MNNATKAKEPDVEPRQNGNSSAKADVTWLRREWRFASVIHFCRTFSEALGIRPFSADELEAAIVNAGSQRLMIAELLCKLARGSAEKPITVAEAASWQQVLSERFRLKHADRFRENPLQERDWFSLSSQERVTTSAPAMALYVQSVGTVNHSAKGSAPPTERSCTDRVAILQLDVLLALCEWRLQDCPVIPDARTGLQGGALIAGSEYNRLALSASQGAIPATKGDALRPTAIGEDAHGARYFFLSDGGQDCRLYREHPPPMGWPEGDSAYGQGSWETACTTLAGINQLAHSFRQSTSTCEQALYSKLAGQIIPSLKESVEARRRREGSEPALEAACSGLQVIETPL